MHIAIPLRYSFGIGIAVLLRNSIRIAITLKKLHW